jgi:hypothetical protein
MKLEIKKETKDQFREKYGNIIDHIKITEITLDDSSMKTFQVFLPLIYSFKINKTDSTKHLVHSVHSGLEKFCNHLDSIIMKRKPNNNLNEIGVYINDNIPDDILYVSPKTYYKLKEIMNKYNSDNYE